MKISKLLGFVCLFVFLSSFITVSALTPDESYVKNKALIGVQDITSYLEQYPEKTVEDLQQDEEFVKLAVQSVGEQGYTFVYSSETGDFLFHPQERFIGESYNAFKQNLPAAWNIIHESMHSTSSRCSEKYGYYDWEEEDGEQTKKFAYIACVSQPTADGIYFSLVSTEYVDESQGETYLKKYDIQSDFSVPRDLIEQKAKDVARQIDIYLQYNPSKTMADLLVDPYFSTLAVQSFGQTGYTAITDQDTSEQYFTSDESLVGTKLSDFKEEIPRLWYFFEKNLLGKCNDAGIYYTWIDEEGNRRDKYAYSVCVQTKTADGVQLGVDASTYLDEFIQNTSVLTIQSASELDYPPLAIVTENGEADGFSIELLEAVLGEVGFDVSFHVGPWSEIKEELAEGSIDVLPLVARTPEREDIYDFSVPHTTLYGAVFTRKGEQPIQSLDDLEGKEIVVMKGDSAEEFVRRNKISNSIITTTTYSDAFTLLSQGNYDAVITQEVTGNLLLQELEIRNIHAPYVLREFKQDFTFAVTEGNQGLLNTLNDGLSKIIISGKYDEIYSRWFGDASETTDLVAEVKNNDFVDFEDAAESIANQISHLLNHGVDDVLKLAQDFDVNNIELTKQMIQEFHETEKGVIWYNIGSDVHPIEQRRSIPLYFGFKYLDNQGNEVFSYTANSFNDDLKNVFTNNDGVLICDDCFSKALNLSEGTVWIGQVLTKYTSKDEVFSELPEESYNMYELVSGRDIMKQGFIRFSTPIYIEGNSEPDGILVLMMDYRHLQEAVKHINPTSNVPVISARYDGNYVLVFDHTGDTIVHPKPDNIRGYLDDGELAGYNDGIDDRPGSIFNVYKYHLSSSYNKLAETVLEKKQTYTSSATDVSGRTKTVIAVPIEYTHPQTNFAETGVFGGVMLSITSEKTETEESIGSEIIDSLYQYILYLSFGLGLMFFLLFLTTKSKTNNKQVTFWYRLFFMLLLLFEILLFYEMPFNIFRFNFFNSVFEKLLIVIAVSLLGSLFGLIYSLFDTQFSPLVTRFLTGFHFFVISLMLFTRLFVKDFIEKSTYIEVISGPLYFLTFFVILLYVALIVVVFLQARKRSQKTMKKNLSILLYLILLIILVVAFLYLIIEIHAPYLLMIALAFVGFMVWFFLLRTGKLFLSDQGVKYLLLAFVLVVVGSIFFVMIITSESFRSYENDQTELSLSAISASRSNHINTYFEQNIERFKLVSSRNNLRNLLKEYAIQPSSELSDEMTDIIIAAKTPIEDIERIGVLDLQGTIISSTNASFIGRNASQREFFKEGKIMEKIFFVQEHNKSKFFISGPFVLDGEVIGVGVMVVSSEVLNSIVSETTGLGETGEIFLLNDLSKMMTPSRFDKEKYLQEINTTASAICEKIIFDDNNELQLHGAQIFEGVNYRGADVTGVVLSISNLDWCLVAEKDRAEVYGPLNKRLTLMWIITTFIIITIIAASIAFNFIITRTLRERVDSQTGMLKKKVSREEKTRKAMLHILSDFKKINVELKEKENEARKINAELKVLNKEKDKWGRNLESQVRTRTRALKKANNDVQNLLHQKTQFLNQVAHDLRTPLTPIRILLDATLKKKLDAPVKKDLKVVKNNVDSLTYLITDVLNLVRIESGKHSMEFEQVDVKEFIISIIVENEPMFKQEGITISKQFEDKLPTLYIDKNKIKEVIGNIISNAKKYYETKNKKLIFEAKKQGTNLEIRITDNGRGIEKKNINRLFEEFFKVDQYHGGNSTGLGLSICRRTIEQHKGKIWAESDGLGKGTTIVILLPIARKTKKGEQHGKTTRR
jgi:signal transduction histidine kinase/ABC-type amino acid transport substrate-binding protein